MPATDAASKRVENVINSCIMCNKNNSVFGTTDTMLAMMRLCTGFSVIKQNKQTQGKKKNKTATKIKNNRKRTTKSESTEIYIVYLRHWLVN